MSLTVTMDKKEGGVFIVAPSGSIDSTTYTILEEELNSILGPKTRGIVFDMRGVNYISSLGIGVILKTERTLQANKGSLIMTNLQPQVKVVFDIMKALPDVPIFASVEEADAYLAKMQQRELEKGKS